MLQTYRHLFGPIASRRLGTSLGIDLVTHKVCSLDCIYCESGATTNLTCLRADYVDFDEVKAEIKHYLSNNPPPDYMTFSGAGEPTLSIRIGETIRFIKECRPEIKVAVLTNGTLLSDKALRAELLPADLVIPSLDAVNLNAFRRINRPERSIDMKSYIEGIADFKKEFSGTMPLEVLILPGINDSSEDIAAVRDAIKKIGPDYIQLNTLDRPGVLKDLVPASREQLEDIAKTLDFSDVRIASSSISTAKKVTPQDLKLAILDMIRRRSCTVVDFLTTLETSEAEVQAILTELGQEGKIVSQEGERGTFYRLV